MEVLTVILFVLTMIYSKSQYKKIEKKYREMYQEFNERLSLCESEDIQEVTILSYICKKSTL